MPKQKNINKPLEKIDGVVQKQKHKTPTVDEYDGEIGDRSKLLDKILAANQVETDELAEVVDEGDWIELKKKKRKPVKKHTRLAHIMQIAPGLHVMRRQILTILFQLEIENGKLKSIPAQRIARACKFVIKESPKLNNELRYFDDRFRNWQKPIRNMNELKMTKAALERITIYIEKKLENMCRWGWVITMAKKHRTLYAESFLTGKELMEGKYDINKSVNFNALARRYNFFTPEEEALEKRVEASGLNSIDQVFSILENADITNPDSNLFALTHLDNALKKPQVMERLTNTGGEFIARLKQERDQQRAQEQRNRQTRANSNINHSDDDDDDDDESFSMEEEEPPKKSSKKRKKLEEDDDDDDSLSEVEEPPKKPKKLFASSSPKPLVVAQMLKKASSKSSKESSSKKSSSSSSSSSKPLVVAQQAKKSKKSSDSASASSSSNPQPAVAEPAKKKKKKKKKQSDASATPAVVTPPNNSSKKRKNQNDNDIAQPSSKKSKKSSESSATTQVAPQPSKKSKQSSDSSKPSKPLVAAQQSKKAKKSSAPPSKPPVAESSTNPSQGEPAKKKKKKKKKKK